MELRGKDRLDLWLDAALKEYGNVEPRSGLETRILANLASRKHVVIGKGWWPVLGAVALTVVLAAAIWIALKPTPPPKESIVAGNAAAIIPATSASVQPLTATAVKPATASHLRKRAPDPRFLNAKEPRLEQFPALRPLSEQEQLLRRYVRDFPQEAAIVALAQAKRQQELEKLMADQGSNNSDQQER